MTGEFRNSWGARHSRSLRQTWTKCGSSLDHQMKSTEETLSRVMVSKNQSWEKITLMGSIYLPVSCMVHQILDYVKAETET